MEKMVLVIVKIELAFSDNTFQKHIYLEEKQRKTAKKSWKTQKRQGKGRKPKAKAQYM